MSFSTKLPGISVSNWLKSHFHFVGQFIARLFRTMWITACFMLAIAAAYNLTQLSNLHQEVTERRQLETTMQDLMLQSVVMRFFSTHSGSALTQKMNEYGYQNPVELVSQLRARLQVSYSLESELDTQTQINKLIDLLSTLEQQMSAFDQTSQIAANKTIDQWFINLGALGSFTRQLSYAQEARASDLQRRNLYLAMAVLAYSLLMVGFHSWTKDKQNRQFLLEMESLHNETRRDPLTNLLNRRGWNYHTNKTLKKLAKFGRTPVGIAILDIDHFKKYNDTFGHDAGDQRLVQFANLLKSHFRPCDMVARIGGEEFAVFLPNCTVEDAKRIIDRIRTATDCNIAFSAGIAGLEECRNIEKAISVADQALYVAKSNGRNQAQIGQPNFSSQSQKFKT